jgi:hypothetical protein
MTNQARWASPLAANRDPLCASIPNLSLVVLAPIATALVAVAFVVAPAANEFAPDAIDENPWANDSDPLAWFDCPHEKEPF